MAVYQTSDSKIFQGSDNLAPRETDEQLKDWYDNEYLPTVEYFKQLEKDSVKWINENR